VGTTSLNRRTAEIKGEFKAGGICLPTGRHPCKMDRKLDQISEFLRRINDYADNTSHWGS
jgi:hypothetical protein